MSDDTIEITYQGVSFEFDPDHIREVAPLDDVLEDEESREEHDWGNCTLYFTNDVVKEEYRDQYYGVVGTADQTPEEVRKRINEAKQGDDNE